MEVKQVVREKMEAFFLRLPSWFGEDGRVLTHPSGVPKLKGILQYMDMEDWSGQMDECRLFVNTMDDIRKTDFRRCFSEWASLLRW